jgi:murein DD-endopeptidase MepM/ murein hydrolase activator NlpD
MAKKTKFHFNPETLNYDPIVRTFAYKSKQVALHFFSAISLAVIFFMIFVSTFDSPQEKQLGLERNRMQAQYKLLDRQINEMQEILTDLQERDDNLYRVILQSEPIPFSVRSATSTNSEFYGQLFKMTNSEIVVATTKRLSSIRKQIYIQSKSYDDVLALSKNKEAMLECIPAIQPVLNKDLKRMASGFGWRVDPVYRTRRFHEGMDFAAPTGTDIYATGNGTVQLAGWKQGYGNTVEINHGFGYRTVYGHMHKINVRAGQKVKRGEVIGLVGNTGKSTGPHLHYEVHFKGKVMNPNNYYFLDLSPEEYDRMIQMSNNSGMMMD